MLLLAEAANPTLSSVALIGTGVGYDLAVGLSVGVGELVGVSVDVGIGVEDGSDVFVGSGAIPVDTSGVAAPAQPVRRTMRTGSTSLRNIISPLPGIVPFAKRDSQS